MKTLEIIKASAGSGKTWTLAREYMKLLIPTDGSPFDPQAFRHILAVTFTNKATEEMKSRIIEELYDLIHKPDYKFPDDRPATPQMKEYAQKALTAILHDYVSFSVSTIDRFFQTVMRAFAREINQYASYKVELDKDSVLQMAVDRMMASLDEAGNEALLKWLTDYSLDQISAGKKWDISAQLNEICGLLVEEEFLRLRRKYRDGLWDKEKIAAFQLKLKEMMASGDKETAATAKLLDGNIYLLGIVSDLNANLTALLKENNLVLLSETTDVLSRIIDGSDTPFIYEKVGTRYDHFMLDEFQDTSRLQWENFRPLLKDAIDRGESSLVVGDIKQSIYRWRGSDLNLLHSEVEQLLAHPEGHVHHRQGNWRSCENVIRFNNEFFGRIGALLGGIDKFKSVAPTIGSYYSDVAQSVARPENEKKGFVRVELIPYGEKKDSPDFWKKRVMERLPDLMAELSKRYPKRSDIAFLVRTNDEGAEIAQTLLALGYPVVTEDSLTLGSCLSVKRLAALLTFIADPTNSVNLTLMKGLFDTVPQLSTAAGDSDSLYETCDTLLRKYVHDVPEGDQPFLLAFLDDVIAYTDKFGSNLSGFVEWWQKVGVNRKISAPKRDDAVTVMTIHKSKGLDFQVVILPFLYEKLSAANPPMIWCEPEGGFADIQLVPLTAKDELNNTVFKERLEEEKKMQCLDAINTAYVAMTRAVQEMYIFAPKPKYNKKDNKLSASYLSVATLLALHLCPADTAVNDATVLEFGARMRGKAPDEEKTAELQPVVFRSHPYGDKLRLSLKGGEFFSREEGIRYHDILSRIDTPADLPQAIEDAVREGILGAAEAPEAEKRISALLESVADRHWFDGTYRALNEIAIVDADGKIHRPDRVLVEKDRPLGQGTALVIDYKFGKREEEYRWQVRRYMKLLRQMGYRDVRGTLWYCNENAENVQ